MKNLHHIESSFLEKFSSLVNCGQHFICVAQPKTGSTFLTNVVADLLDWDIIDYNSSIENFRSYSLSIFLEVFKKNGVVHLHSMPSPLLVASAISVSSGIIVLKRDFIEYCHSILAHIDRGEPTLIQRKLASLNKYVALKFIALQEFGWVYRFVDTWEAHSERLIQDNGERFVKIIDHSELFSNTELILLDCLRHSGFDVDEYKLKDIIYKIKKDNKKSNYHKTTFDYDESSDYDFFKDIRNLAPKMFS